MRRIRSVVFGPLRCRTVLEKQAMLPAGTAVHTAARLLQSDPTTGDLPQLARIVGLSPGHLSRLFKAQTGVALSRYRNQQRLLRYRLIYGTGEHTTALSAAFAAGFGSYAQFYRVFREETGHAPSTAARP